MKDIGMIQKVDKKIFFLIILFLLFSFEPPIWLPFGFPKSTLGVAKIGLLLLTFVAFFGIWIKQKDFFYKRKNFFYGPGLFLLAIFTSIFFAANLNLVSQVLLFVIIGLVFYFLAIYFFTKSQDLELFYLAVLYLAIFSGIFSLFLVLQTRFSGLQFVQQFLSNIFPSEGFNRFLGDLERNRIQTFWFPEFSFPISLYFIFSKRFLKLGTVSLILAAAGIMLSNNRYQFVSMCFGIVLFILLNRHLIWKQKKILKYFSVILISSLIVFLLAGNYFLRKNVFQRFMLSNYQQDVKSLTSREYLFNQAWGMFSSAPFFGVGFRNFSFYAQGQQGFFNDPLWKLNIPTYYWHLEPHNIFFQILSETGLFGLLTFSILLITFLKQDFYLFKNTKSPGQKMFFSAIIIASWTYIVNEQFTFINDSIASQVFFWFSRGILAAFYIKFSTKTKIRKNKQKILFVSQQWDRSGGVEKEINLLKSNFDSSIFVINPKKHGNILALFRIWKGLLKKRPDIVLSYCEYANLATGCALLFYPFNFRFFACEHNNPTFFFQRQKFKRFKKLLILFFYNYVASKIIVVSKTIKEELVNNFLINSSKVEIINISLENQKIKKLAEKKIRLPKSVEKKKYFVAIGRLSWEKRFDYLIEIFKKALKKNNNLKLLIIGDGSEKNKLEKQINDLSMTDNIFLLGWQKNPYAYLSRSSALLISSQSEGSPRVIVEAGICQIPVISSFWQGIEEFIDNKKNGLIIQNENNFSGTLIKFRNNYKFNNKFIGKYDLKKNVIYYKKLFVN